DFATLGTASTLPAKEAVKEVLHGLVVIAAASTGRTTAAARGSLDSGISVDVHHGRFDLLRYLSKSGRELLGSRRRERGRVIRGVECCQRLPLSTVACHRPDQNSQRQGGYDGKSRAQ